MENGQPHVSVCELFLGLLSFENSAEQLFFDLEIDAQKIKNTFEWLEVQEKVSKHWSALQSRAGRKPKGPVNRAYTSVATPWLDGFSEDLTGHARNGAIEPSIGSEDVVFDIFKHFASGKFAVLLSGNTGTGKTTAIHYLAELMATEDVPKFFQDKRLIQLSVSSLVAGADKPGEIEKRMLGVLNEIKIAGNVILFIDRIEDLIGLGTETSETMDLAAVLAQELERRYFTLIAATTPDTESKFISRSALAPIISQIKIEEMNFNNSIRALGVKSLSIEKDFGVYFTYQSIETAVELSHKFIRGMSLPGKAVEVLERAAQVAVSQPVVDGEKKVLAEYVAQVVAELTKIPVAQVSSTESEQLLNLEHLIHKKVVDQEEAVDVVAQAMRRARARLTSEKRPIASFLFLGPTGVGKTQVAKTLADVYFGGQKNIIRLDMSEYSGADGVAKLIGQAGSNYSGYLTEQINTKPFSLILLDEFEKASAQVHNLFLQIMEDGRLTDNQGKTFDFTHTIIIATSNAASEFIQEKVKQKVSVEEIKQEIVDSQLNKYLKPELINRFDAVVVFKPLSKEDVRQITKLLLNELIEKITVQGIILDYSLEAVAELAELGFDPKFGARPLRRVIQDKLENKIAEMILAKKVARRDIIFIQSADNLEIQKAEEL